MTVNCTQPGPCRAAASEDADSGAALTRGMPGSFKESRRFLRLRKAQEWTSHPQVAMSPSRAATGRAWPKAGIDAPGQGQGRGSVHPVHPLGSLLGGRDFSPCRKGTRRADLKTTSEAWPEEEIRGIPRADPQAVAAQQRHIQALEKELQSIRRNVGEFTPHLPRDWLRVRGTYLMSTTVGCPASERSWHSRPSTLPSKKSRHWLMLAAHRRATLSRGPKKRPSCTHLHACS